MLKTSSRRPRAGLVTLACALAPVLATLAGCGGGSNGIVPDNAGTSTTQQMDCVGGCVESSSRSTGQLEAHFYIVDDGSRAQAQAGFYSGFSLGYNVELDGDAMNFVQGTTSTTMGLPKPGSDAFVNLFTLPDSPYLADFKSLPAGEVVGQFQMVRAAQTLTSTVTLPTPFRITAPGDNATVSKASDAVAIQLDSVQPNATWDVHGASCIDDTGSTWTLANAGTSVFFSTADSRTFSFDAARYFATLKPTRSDGTLATLVSCTLTVHATVTNNGTMADGFKAGSSISALQLRAVTLDLR